MKILYKSIINFSLILLFLLINPNSLVAQGTLKRSYTRFFQLKDSARFYMKTDLEKSMKFADSTVNFARNIKKDSLLANGLLLKANIFQNHRNEKSSKKAIKLYMQSLKLFENFGDSIGIFNTRNGLSYSYSTLNNFPAALSYSKKNMVLAQYLKEIDKLSFKTLGTSHITLGTNYLRLKLIDSSIVHLEKARRIFHRDTNLLSAEISSIGNLALAYKMKKDFDRALLLQKEAHEISLKNQDMRSIISTANNIGNTYKELEIFDKATYYYHKALVTSKNFPGSSFYTSALYYNIGENFFLKKKIDSANLYIDSSISLASGVKANRILLMAYELKSKLSEEKGDSANAYTYLIKYKNLKNSTENKQNYQKTTEILFKEETRKQEVMKEKFFNNINKKNRVLIILSIVILLLFFSFYLIFYKYRSKFTFLSGSETELETKLQESKQQKDLLYRQITTATANVAIKNDILQHLSTTLAEIIEQNKSKEMQKNLENAQYLIRDNLELSKMWKDFFMHFEKVHPDFIQKLSTNYNLSPNDLKICAFIKMNLSNKEIAQLLNIHLNSVHTILYRLKKKLDLPKDQSVFNFLQFYEHY